MRKFALSPKERKFLIYWNTFHLFGLLVNLFHLQGLFEIAEYQVWYLWDARHSNEAFWPFVSFFETIQGKHYPGTPVNFNTYIRFNGIYYYYSIEEYLVYTLSGLGIIFVPKLLKRY